MENKELLKTLHEVAETFLVESLAMERKMKEYIKKYIYALQGGDNKFLAFNDEIGFPIFRDYSDEMAQTIFGVRVQRKVDVDGSNIFVLYIYTDCNSIDDMDNNTDGTWSEGWFIADYYGSFEWTDLLTYCSDWQKYFIERD
jgi:hypothetical protein